MTDRDKRSFILFFAVLLLLLFNAESKVYGSYGSSRILSGSGSSSVKQSCSRFCNNVIYSFEDMIYKTKKYVTPFFEYRGEYDDNIFLTRSSKQWDYIHILKPGIALHFSSDPEDENGRLMKSLHCRLGPRIRKYTRHTDLSENLFQWDGNADISGVFFDRLIPFFRVDKMQKLASQVYPSSELEESRDSWERNVGSLTLKYGADYIMDSGQDELVLSYKHREISYEKDEDKASNAIRDSFSITEFRHIAEDTDIFLNCSYALIGRPKMAGADASYLRGTAGFVGQLGYKTKGSLGIGYTFWYPEKGKETGELLASANLTTMLSKRFSLGLRASYSIEDSAEQLVEDEAYDDQYEAETETFTRDGETGAWPEWPVNIGALTVKAARFSCNFSFRPAFNDKMIIQARYHVENLQYDSKGDRLQHSAGSMIRYKLMKNIFLLLKYDHRRSIAKEDADSYINNIVGVQIKMEI